MVKNNKKVETIYWGMNTLKITMKLMRFWVKWKSSSQNVKIWRDQRKRDLVYLEISKKRHKICQNYKNIIEIDRLIVIKITPIIDYTHLGKIKRRLNPILNCNIIHLIKKYNS
jgi:hypothetical protein